MSTHVTRAEVCVAAVADCFRDDGEILANPIGTIPMIGGRLCRATSNPALMMTDGEAALIQGRKATGGYEAGDWHPEAWNPYRRMFDLVWSGRRHVMMGATQIDRYGNQNIAAIGEYSKPAVALLGYRGAPGNTTSDPTSYWVPSHTAKVFVEAVDTVTGIGYDRAATLGAAGKYHSIPFVVSNLGVFDFDSPDHTMRIRSVHPGVTVDDVVAATGFDIVVPDDVPTSRLPTAEELELIREVIDPDATREREVPDVD